MTYHRPTSTAGTRREAHTARKEVRMSDTPRTDAASRMAFSGEYMVPIQEAQKLERDLTQYKEANAGLMRACDNLESEIADAKETIEMLEIRHGATMLCHEAQMDEVTKQRDALAALAATKGGQP